MWIKQKDPHILHLSMKQHFLLWSASSSMLVQVPFAGLVCFHIQFPSPAGFCAGSLCSSGFLLQPRAVHIKMTCPGCNPHLHTKATLHDGQTDGSVECRWTVQRMDGWMDVPSGACRSRFAKLYFWKNTRTDARFSKAVQIIAPGRGLRPQSTQWA